MALAFSIGQVLAVEGEDYVVQSVSRLAATQCTWQVARLSAAGDAGPCMLALSDGEIYEAAPVEGPAGGPSSPPRRGDRAVLDGATFELISCGSASLEAEEKDKPTAFDRGDLAVYHRVSTAAGEAAVESGAAESAVSLKQFNLIPGGRAAWIQAAAEGAAPPEPSTGACYLVVFTSPRRYLGFVARAMPASSVSVYGQV